MSPCESVSTMDTQLAILLIVICAVIALGLGYVIRLLVEIWREDEKPRNHRRYRGRFF